LVGYFKISLNYTIADPGCCRSLQSYLASKKQGGIIPEQENEKKNYAESKKFFH
jgi:hypothetical protein